MGDILLATGAISYLGAFNGKFRTSIITEDWIPKVKHVINVQAANVAYLYCFNETRRVSTAARISA